jgi:phosphoribosylformylglycinamidine synthase
VIGRVTDDGLYRVRENGDIVCEIPGEQLVGGCPTYEREATESDEVRALREWQPDPSHLQPAVAHPVKVLLRLLASPNIASKRWVYNQYDTTVRTATVIGPGGDAGVLRIRGTQRGIAATVDCNGRYVYLNPRVGAMGAMAEAARNLVCVGARPRAVTDNLNFGSPLRPAVYYQMREAVLGLAEACRVFDTPVTGGNVSLYNESPTGAIYPTPVVGVVGVLDDVSLAIGSAFRAAGDAIILLGTNTDEIGGSEYLKVIHGLVAGDAPAVDLKAERALQEAVLEMTANRLLSSAHDCAEGGLAVCLAECAIGGETNFGLDVELADTIATAPLLFGEAHGRIVVSCTPSNVESVLAIADKHGVPAAEIGAVGENRANVRFTVRTPTVTIDVPVHDLEEVWSTAIPRLMDRFPG